MSNKTEPAYPTQELRGLDGGGILAPSYGLTKRELIAAMAMQGALGGVPGSHLRPENLAQESVAHADALLEALK